MGTAVKDAATLAEHLFKFMDDLELDYWHFLVGQCYDGAVNMSGWLTGLNVRIRDIATLALFLHCYAHQLNLCLVAGCDKIKGFYCFIDSAIAKAKAFFHKSS